MSATFASPLSAVLLSVELLLFEWKPRSLVPVALASVAAAVTRRYIIGMGPLFPTPTHPAFIGPKSLLECALVGVMAGVLSALLTISVYAAEDSFKRLPIHWMWWPAPGDWFFRRHSELVTTPSALSCKEMAGRANFRHGVRSRREKAHYCPIVMRSLD